MARYSAPLGAAQSAQVCALRYHIARAVGGRGASSQLGRPSSASHVEFRQPTDRPTVIGGLQRARPMANKMVALVNGV